MAQWYIQDDMFEQGPFTAGEMRSKVNAGAVVETTLVRKDSAKKFMAARSYKGLIPEQKTPSEDAPTHIATEIAMATNTSLIPEPTTTEHEITVQPSPQTQEQAQDDAAHTATVRTEMLHTRPTNRMFLNPEYSPAMQALSMTYLIIALLALGFFVYVAI